MSDDERSLPLFLLNTVLFPGMLLPLHVFEQRYRLMMRACLDSDRTFGVSLIREGVEVGGPAHPFEVGTFARIVDVDRLDDGRMNLVVLGIRRYRLIRIVEQQPFLVGRVTLLRPADEPIDRAFADRVRSRYRAFIRELRGTDEDPQHFQLADDPETLSFQIAATLGIGTHERQRLLEVESTPSRLKGLDGLIRREHSALRVLGRNIPPGDVGPFSPN